MFVQHEMIRKVELLGRQDLRIRAVLQYGSFTHGEGDRYSDIEFWLYVEDTEIHQLDEREWVRNVAPLLAWFENEFGTGVAIFEHLVRGEFHFAAAADMPEIRSWPLGDEAFAIDAMVMLDRTGELREHLRALAAAPSRRLSRERLQDFQDRFVNWILLGINLVDRGEYARALDALSHVQRYLLWLARVVEGSTDKHFLTPSRFAEQDLSEQAYERFAATAARLDAGELRDAYRSAWDWYVTLARQIGDAHRTDTREPLIQAIDRRMR